VKELIGNGRCVGTGEIWNWRNIEMWNFK